MTLKHIIITFLIAITVTAAAYFSGTVAADNLIASVITGAVFIGVMADADLSFGRKRLGIRMGASIGILFGAIFAVTVSTGLSALSNMA